ncbi:hypothetical protein BGZ60DRAFT_421886 [Tricladium varicosporioides]|nr:hypothetical protein BGZ60DRAFT_421886 [Hymenoscyphus varicosporioides]
MPSTNNSSPIVSRSNQIENWLAMVPHGEELLASERRDLRTRFPQTWPSRTVSSHQQRYKQNRRPKAHGMKRRPESLETRGSFVSAHQQRNIISPSAFDPLCPYDLDVFCTSRNWNEKYVAAAPVNVDDANTRLDKVKDLYHKFCENAPKETKPSFNPGIETKKDQKHIKELMSIKNIT